jgi:hypothetical protein
VFVGVDEESTTTTAEGLEQGYVVCNSDDRFLLLFTFLKKNRKKKIIGILSYTHITVVVDGRGLLLYVSWLLSVCYLSAVCLLSPCIHRASRATCLCLCANRTVLKCTFISHTTPFLALACLTPSCFSNLLSDRDSPTPYPLLSNTITVTLQHHNRDSPTPYPLLSNTITVTLQHHNRYSITL